MNIFFTPDLIFFILVAAFLIIRLRSVLGRRTGNEKKTGNFFSYQDSTITAKKSNKLAKEKELAKNEILDFENVGNRNNKEMKHSLIKICSLDRNFSPKKFLLGAKIAFESIIESYAKGDLNKVKYLLGPNVFSAFSKEIKSRIQKKRTLEHSLISLKKTDIEKINVKSSIADIVVKFVSEQVNLLKNDKGKIIEGNEEYTENHIDYWTFSRDLKSSNPNWKLVVTEAGKQ